MKVFTKTVEFLAHSRHRPRGPAIDSDILGDVRLVHGTGVSYFGPFAFSVRLPEG